MLGGCRPRNALVGRAIAETDLVGAWRYPELSGGDGADRWVVTIQFASDRTYRQTLVPPRARHLIQHTGAWRIEGGTVKMESLVAWDGAAAGQWTCREQTWLMIASAKHPGTLALNGGLAADHSMDREMDRISADECRLLTSLAPAAGR